MLLDSPIVTFRQKQILILYHNVHVQRIDYDRLDVIWSISYVIRESKHENMKSIKVGYKIITTRF